MTNFYPFAGRQLELVVSSHVRPEYRGNEFVTWLSDTECLDAPYYMPAGATRKGAYGFAVPVNFRRDA